MAKLYGAQRLVLKTIQDSPKDAAGYVTDDQIAQSTKIALVDVRDWLLTLMKEGYIDLTRNQSGYSASINPKASLELNLLIPSTPLTPSERTASPSNTAPSLQTILMLAADPRGTPPLRLDLEARQIERTLERAKYRDRFRLVMRWAVTVDDLRRAILDHEPSIVHFSGRGGKTEGLTLENDQGYAYEVSGDTLSRLFGLLASKIKCVVLNSCYSDSQANALVQQIDYVIGLKNELGDEAVIEFTASFYDALAAGRNFQDAFEFGLQSIRMTGIPDYLLPVLKKKL